MDLLSITRKRKWVFKDIGEKLVFFIGYLLTCLVGRELIEMLYHCIFNCIYIFYHVLVCQSMFPQDA